MCILVIKTEEYTMSYPSEYFFTWWWWYPVTGTGTGWVSVGTTLTTDTVCQLWTGLTVDNCGTLYICVNNCGTMQITADNWSTLYMVYQAGTMYNTVHRGRARMTIHQQYLIGTRHCCDCIYCTNSKGTRYGMPKIP